MQADTNYENKKKKNPNWSITNKKNKWVIINPPIKQSPGLEEFTDWILLSIYRNNTNALQALSEKKRMKEHL